MSDRTKVRDFALKFLYQCDTERLFHFSPGHLQKFIENFAVPEDLAAPLEEICRGILDRVDTLDTELQALAQNWSTGRMALTDRAVLRLAAYELLHTDVPTKVVLNEAIELAKLYGTEHSSKFVNGLLHNLAKSRRP